MFAYEQCLLCLGHHPDVWIEAAAYLEHSSRILTEKGVHKPLKGICFSSFTYYLLANCMFCSNNNNNNKVYLL